MKILLLVSAFNSLTQAVYTALLDRGDEIAVAYAISEEQMLEEIGAFAPELILCPFLKQYIPPSIYENYATFIFHPGPRGDRGPNALEYALQSHTKEWGVVILRANELYDGGDIYAEVPFNVRDTYKASLYRQEVTQASLRALELFFENLAQKRKELQILNPIHKKFTQKDRAIDWEKDTTRTIIEKIYLSDSLPGVLDEILGIPCYLYGVWKEDEFRGSPKEILAKRDGAICLGTIDGAVWISHLKEPGKFKLPATYVLKEKLKGVKEERLPLLFDKSYETFYEVSVEKRDNVAYLCFNFHNGAMNAEQCIRLKYAVEYLKNECDVLVLVGGMDFFSNGIHLNILEDSRKQGEDGWANINAMNDLVSSILYADEVVTVASFARNAGAGGVFMGLACDYVVAKERVVFNPHYKTLGLSGSEYHTYTLPGRVGKAMAEKLLDECLPVSAQRAEELGMLDKVFAHENYYEELYTFALSCYDDDFLWGKQEYLEANRERIEALKEKELAVMHPEFWDEESPFHTLRREFVYKLCPRQTPQRLKRGRKDA
ncbi:hydrogenase maturation protein [Sulfurovum sp. NBC37-1]|uniref:hydrogenase maturation protein n=1 Tax=Sulfurovum sp. (strain NBC37-1) TaxID=387093 RepID=UPI0001587CDB|nr:hydrogenase maturation protein [Sulfurovum sp. NBC37-1]BAF72595.1 hydrogenase maturation protein HoxX [Sulfurovum sp. NBC37-1]